MIKVADGSALRGPEEIYQRVRTAILDGELPPGSVTSQVALAQSIGVTRTPLREALRMLQMEGLIEAEPGRRVRIAAVTAHDLEELWIVRVALEAEAARLSIPLLTPEDIATLEGEIAVMVHYERERDYLRWRVPHRTFHRRLTRPAGVRVNELLSQLSDYSERYRRLHYGNGPGPPSAASHREILDAFRSRDRDRGASLLVTHLARPAFEVSVMLDPEYQPARLREAVLDVGGEVPDTMSSPPSAGPGPARPGS